MQTKNYLLFLVIIVTFAVFNSPPARPQASGSLIAGAQSVRVASGDQFLDFPVVPDEKLFAIPVPKNSLQAPEISAKAALARDPSSGVVIFQKNPETKLPIASLTKLMTALIVVEQAALDDEVEIRPADLNTVPFRINLAPYEKVTVHDLLKAMLISSANDASLSLARHVSGSSDNFVKAMNDKARSLGMSSTQFANPVGFDSPYHYSTAADLAALVEEFLNHADLLGIVKMKSATISSLSGKHIQLYTTNKLLVERPEVTGLKTGFTSEAKGSLIILVEKAGHRFYSIILGSDDRERETALIMDWIEDNYLWK